ncbi:SH3 domain-containing protein [Streptomyces buecherae]|uniref:SH3 domain-containing protein n=1 Tax=Streptomyces buecherae TaxID=2763006 RepID=A0A7H8NKF5_9ACTN|nr:SH3 domain-containing protein [Streptomyces buecherae]QKW55031.1 SH3 domain-containing protein [Streptomyces buecherae]
MTTRSRPAVGAVVVLVVAVLGTVAADAAGAPRVAAPATAPAWDCHHQPELPYKLHAKSARIFAKPTRKAPVVGVLYPRHRIKVHGHRRGWVRLTDRTTRVTGYVPDRYVHRDVRTCPAS